MSREVKLVKSMCDKIVDAAEKGRISVEEANFRLSLIESRLSRLEKNERDRRYYGNR